MAKDIQFMVFVLQSNFVYQNPKYFFKHLGVSRVGPTTKDNKYWDIIHVFQNELFFQMEKK